MRESPLYLIFGAPYTPNEALVRRLPHFLSLRLVCGLISLCGFGVLPTRSQAPAIPSAPALTKQASQSHNNSEKQPELPAQIELLETRVHFEENGDSRKEVHTRVHIHNELGARQFARLAFDYNRSFQQIEFPLVRITHAGGGTVDILPSAISDQPNPAVINAPTYQEVRVKSVRILGLAPGDLLEYRVITTTTHHPLAPDFWLDHTFDRSGVVSDEVFELDLPNSRKTQIRINPDTPTTTAGPVGQGDATRFLYGWRRSSPKADQNPTAPASDPDVLLTTFASWQELADHLDSLRKSSQTTDDSIEKKGIELTSAISDKNGKTEVLYDFVAKRIKTIDLSPASTGFHPRNAAEILSSGYGTPLDKVSLLDKLRYDQISELHPTFFGVSTHISEQLPLPSFLVGLVATVFIHWPSISDARAGLGCDHCGHLVWIDPALEVAPYGMVRSELRKKMGLFLGFLPGEARSADPWRRIPNELPFSSSQRANVDASLTADGTLNSKVRYIMRGDNELLLRVAFHQAPKEKWREVAQLLALSDGFRGKITQVTASDPYATKEPFSVEYEITQPKFVDWSKKPVRIPALLPLVGLPDPPAKPAAGAAVSSIDLGTPLEIETQAILHLPPGTTVHTPTGTSVVRDYATFASKYAVDGSTVSASRHLNFLQRELPAERAADYNAFVRAVQSDEAQEFTLERADATPAGQSAPMPPGSAAKPKP